MSRGLPPLELAVEVTDASGARTRWDPGSQEAGNRPQGISFSTKRGDGFGEGTVTLSRRIDRDYVDLHLFDDVRISGYDGSIAYEGRIGAQPRSFDSAHSITVQLAGWMSHARDKPFTDIYIDRDLGVWHESSRARQATLLTSNYGLGTFSAARDAANASPALIFEFSGNWLAPKMPLSEAWYDAGPGNAIALMYFDMEAMTNVAGDANFVVQVFTSDTDGVAGGGVSGDLWAGSSATYNSAVPSGPRRYVGAQFYYPFTPNGADGYSYRMTLKNVTMIGDHGLTLPGSGTTFGVTASDVMKHIAGLHCPKLNTDGVQRTDWPIPHLVFRDPTDPYDAFLELNKYHLWEIGVWENRTLTFAPADRSDYDWEVRLSDFGVKVSLQGDTTEDLANGIIVDFQNVLTGGQDRVTPDDTVELTDPSATNPATMAGIKRWTKISLSSPTTGESAIQIGRAALAEFNQPKSPGSISVVGHVKDRAGHWQPGWKVRAGDTVAITDHPNSSPRLVTETQWNQDSKELQMTVDSASKRLDAQFDRLATALSAAGLG